MATSSTLSATRTKTTDSCSGLRDHRFLLPADRTDGGEASWYGRPSSSKVQATCGEDLAPPAAADSCRSMGSFLITSNKVTCSWLRSGSSAITIVWTIRGLGCDL